MLTTKPLLMQLGEQGTWNLKVFLKLYVVNILTELTVGHVRSDWSLIMMLAVMTSGETTGQHSVQFVSR